jgi:hypothetical protein
MSFDSFSMACLPEGGERSPAVAAQHSCGEDVARTGGPHVACDHGLVAFSFRELRSQLGGDRTGAFPLHALQPGRQIAALQDAEGRRLEEIDAERLRDHFAEFGIRWAVEIGQDHLGPLLEQALSDQRSRRAYAERTHGHVAGGNHTQRGERQHATQQRLVPGETAREARAGWNGRRLVHAFGWLAGLDLFVHACLVSVASRLAGMALLYECRRQDDGQPDQEQEQGACERPVGDHAPLDEDVDDL